MCQHGQVDLFSPADVEWRTVSTRLGTARLLGASITAAIVAAVVLLVAALTETAWVAALVLVPALVLAWSWWVIRRQVRAIGYAERAEDLLIRRGILFRSMVVVPYGRMQFVDVEAGPLARRLGFAKVQLHTASPSSDAAIPGLPPDEAARLRDRLARRGEAELAGL